MSDKICLYPSCDCPVSFPEGQAPRSNAECPRLAGQTDQPKPVELEMAFTQNQIVAVLGMFCATSHGFDPNAFEVAFNLAINPKEGDEGGVEFGATIKMTQVV